MHCRQCGKQIEDTASSCPYCGRKVIADVIIPNSAKGHLGLNEIRYAGFLRRLIAWIIDYAVISVVFIIVIGVYSLASTRASGLLEDSAVTEFVIVIWVLIWLYFALMESSRKQGTIGKFALKIKVTDMNGNRISFARASGRFWAKLLSYFLLIGYIMVGFTEKRQGLHDILSKCLVVLNH